MFQGWLSAYRWSLDHVLRVKFLTLIATFGTIAVTVWLFMVSPYGFFPDEDTDVAYAETRGPPDASHEYLVPRHREVAAILQADPAVERVMHWVHLNREAVAIIRLKPRKERDSWTVISARWKKAVEGVSGVRVDFSNMKTV